MMDVVAQARGPSRGPWLSLRLCWCAPQQYQGARSSAGQRLLYGCWCCTPCPGERSCWERTM